MIRALLALGVVAAAATPAVADDSVGTADTIASTWSGGAFELSDHSERFELALGTLIDGIRIRGEISAPLDDATRTAVFFNAHGLAPAFRGAFHIGYDSTYQALALTPDDTQLLAYCTAHQIDPCTQSAVDKSKQQAAQSKQQAATTQRRNGQPIGGAGLYWGLGLDLAYAYDRTTAYVDDIGSSTTATFRSTDLQLGGSGVVYVPGGWVVSLRAGYERNNPVELGSFQRCNLLPSSDPTVTGQSCSDAQYLIANPGPQHSGYARLAGAYYPQDSVLAAYLSASELRLNLEDLGTDTASFDIHLLLFAKGMDLGGGSVRIGVGTTVRVALASPAGADYKSGDLYDYSLFGIAGTSF